MTKVERARVLKVMRKEVNAVRFFAGSDAVARHTVEEIAAVLGIGLSEIFKGTRYERKGD